MGCVRGEAGDGGDACQGPPTEGTAAGLSAGSLPDLPGAKGVTRCSYVAPSRGVSAMKMAVAEATVAGDMMGLKTGGGNHATSRVSPPFSRTIELRHCSFRCPNRTPCRWQFQVAH